MARLRRRVGRFAGRPPRGGAVYAWLLGEAGRGARIIDHDPFTQVDSEEVVGPSGRYFRPSRSAR